LQQVLLIRLRSQCVKAERLAIEIRSAINRQLEFDNNARRNIGRNLNAQRKLLIILSISQLKFLSFRYLKRSRAEDTSSRANYSSIFM
jgi:hypothetical protein